jgi:chemotaxis receptor (MCP) glutamine deamidase CheD
MNSIESVFDDEYRYRKKCFVTINEAFVRDQDYVFHINLGSCASVILCGIDPDGRVWIGANHLFKSREKNEDTALFHVAEIYNSLNDKGIVDICCLGLFGAGYRENSMAGDVAKRNVMSILEALNFYNLSIELFQTGFSQDLALLVSKTRNSFLIRHYNISTREKKIIEIPLNRLFPSYSKTGGSSLNGTL